MRKKFISMLVSFFVVCGMIFSSILNVCAEDKELVQVDGSYLTHEDSSTGTVLSNPLLRGTHLMDGDSTISKAGRGRIYAYGATTANHTVDYVAVIVYVDRYNEETGKWGQIDCWTEEKEDTYYVATSKTITVERGYYYRVHSDHFAGNDDDDLYDEAISYTDGIWID